MRVAGSRIILPDAVTRNGIRASGRERIIGSFKICLDDRGSVSSLAMLKSTGFPAYDQKIQAEMRQWIFKPYKVNGRTVPVCSAMTFIYDASKPSP
jgi:hypothetical protein